jgi:hypothetical protein
MYATHIVDTHAAFNSNERGMASTLHPQNQVDCSLYSDAIKTGFDLNSHGNGSD